MFTVGEDDDFDFAEDFLQDAFELNKKEPLRSSGPTAADATKTVDCNSLKNNNNTGNYIIKSKQIQEQRRPSEGLEGIESLLEDDWDPDDGFLSSIPEVGKVFAVDENSTTKRDVISSTSIRKASSINTILPSAKRPSNFSVSQCPPALSAEKHDYATTPLRYGAAQPVVTNSLNSVGGLREMNVTSAAHPVATNTLKPIGGPRKANISSAANRKSSVGVLRTAASDALVGEIRGNKTCSSFNGHAANSAQSPINRPTLPKRTQHVLGLEYRHGSSPGISPGYSSHAKRKFPGPAGILPQLSADGKFPETTSPVVDCQRSPIVIKEQCVAQKVSSSSQSSQCPFQGGAWEKMKKDLDIDDDDPNSLLARFNIAWVLLKAMAKELPKKKAPVIVAVLKAITLEGRRAKVVLQDETGEIIGTIHEKVLEEYASALQPGTVLVLRQVSIFSPTSCKHYLNVTPSNIVALYGSNGVVVGGQDVSGAHLLAAAEESLLEATMNVTKTSHRADWARSSTWSNSPASSPPTGAQKGEPVTTTTEEQSFWEEDDLDTFFQGLEEKDLCG